LIIVVLLAAGLVAQAEVDYVADSKSASHPVDARDLIELRDMSGLSVSPDGRHVAFQLQEANLAANRYELGWHVASSLRAGPARNVGDGGEPFPKVFENGIVNGDRDTHRPVWSPDGRWIAYLARYDSDVQLWRSAVDGSVRERVMRSAGRVAEFAWSEDSSRIYFTMDDSWQKTEHALREEGERGYLVDERFLPFYSSKPVWPRDAFRSLSPVRAVDLRTGEERPATEAEVQAFEGEALPLTVAGHPYARVIARPYGHQDTGAVIAWAEPEPDQRDGRHPPLTVHAGSVPGVETSLRCIEPACTGLIEDIWLSPDATDVYFLRREGVDNGSLGLYAWSLETEKARTILRTDDYLADCDLAREGLVCVYEAASTPRRLVSIDLTDGALATLADPNPGFHSLRKGAVKRLTWTSPEYGQEAFGYLVLPPDYEEGRRYPLVITTYTSRGFLRGATGDEYPIFPLAQNGFVVLNFDQPSDWSLLARATSVRETDEEMRKHDRGLDRIRSSVDAAIDLLMEMELIDPRRLAITGLSLGAEIVFYCLTRTDHPFAAAVVSSPPSDPIFYYLGGAEIQHRLDYRGYGFPKGENASRWEERAPSSNVETISAPLLVQAAESEYLLALELAASMQVAQRPFELYVFPDEKHIKSQPKHRYYTYLRNVQWLKFWLQGVEEAEPVDPRQYERWRAMQSTMSP
jgi:dipeptidyl aminopeptidase/acylaminoacyl peptidase